MSRILFDPDTQGAAEFLAGASGSIRTAAFAKGQKYNYDFHSDTPSNHPGHKLQWEGEFDVETDDEGELFLSDARDHLHTELEGKQRLYGFDFEAETPLQSGTFTWEVVEKPGKTKRDADSERLSMSTLASE